MSYPKYYCPECGQESKCIGYRFGDGVSQTIPMGYHHIYKYKCVNNHEFEVDSLWDKEKFMTVGVKQ